jgi:hypothetical protein
MGVPRMMMANVVVADARGRRIAEDDRKSPVERSEHETCGNKGAQAEHRQYEGGRPAPPGSCLNARSATGHGFMEANLRQGRARTSPLRLKRRQLLMVNVHDRRDRLTEPSL